MDKQEDYSRVLGRVYGYLVRSHLVKQGVVTPESLKYFTDNLNSALPDSENSAAVAAAVKEIYYTNKFVFSRIPVGRGSGPEKYVLVTDARNIARHFGLPKNVLLRWDNVNRKYIMNVDETDYQE